MSTLIRPELSETNRYWIEKHRYYELKHFCLQYPLWRHAYNSLIDYPGSWPQLVPPCKTCDYLPYIPREREFRNE